MKAFDSSEFIKHNAEANERWGRTDAYRQHEEKTKNYAQQKWDDLARGMDGIMTEFALCMKRGEAPDSKVAQQLVKTLQAHITENYYHCTKEILAGLGQMYVADARFQSNIDRHGQGTAAFIRDAIDAYCGK